MQSLLINANFIFKDMHCVREQKSVKTQIKHGRELNLTFYPPFPAPKKKGLPLMVILQGQTIERIFAGRRLVF